MPPFVLPTYATLINQKLVGETKKGRYIAIEWHFLKACLSSIVRQIYLDEDWYLSRYPDVRKGIAEGLIQNGQDHYCEFGYFENRIPFKILVDEAYYLQVYPDVKEAIGVKLYQSGQEHFEAVGFSEGRLPYPNFEFTSSGSSSVLPPVG